MTSILTMNAGSSSVRFGLFDTSDPIRRISASRLEGIPHDPAAALRAFIGPPEAEPWVVAHRVVNGGPHLTEPCVIDDQVRRAIEEATPLAPLHNPSALSWMRTTAAAFPRAVHVAVFDTGAFAHLPEAAATYALPRALVHRHGLRRMGFHGLAHRSMLAGLRAVGAPLGRVITLQLGGGASAAAFRDETPVDTSMGFTPSEGLVMATRAGDLDSGLLLLLMKREGLDPDAAEDLITQQSGLLGLCGSTDWTEILKRTDPDARLAAEVYSLRIKKYIGAYVAALGGCDVVAFGGGVGEHQPAVRAMAMAGLEALGIELDAAANATSRTPALISAPHSRTAIWVVPTDEETMLAKAAAPFVGA